MTDWLHHTKQADLQQNLIYHRKKNQNWRKISTELIMLNILDGMKMKLMERCQFGVNEWVSTARWFGWYCWWSENSLLGNISIRIARAFHEGTTRKREREKKRELEHFSNKAPFTNNSLIGPIYNWPVLARYADPFTIKRNIMKFRNKMKLLLMAKLTLQQCIIQHSEG